MTRYDRAWYKEMGLTFPFYRTDKKYSRSQSLFKCKICKDTAFELLEKSKPTKKCCRCGNKF